ncbi:MAG: glycosyltransferase family 4 protein [Planctomycetes bacterium]|nr:glycosyltransferase family 4 protein [Planctomycetota bacterium]
MRILLVTAAFLPESIGGVELHVRGIARELLREHQVLIFCRGADPKRPEFDLERYQVDGIDVARLNYLFGDCTSFERIYLNPAIRARFEQVLAEFQPDVVHVHHLTCLSTDLIDAARQHGAGVAMTLHDFWMGCPRGQRMTPDLQLCQDIVPERCAACLARMWGGWFGRGRDLEQLAAYHEWVHGLLLRVDRLITPSASSREVFSRYGIPRERITVVENGLDHAPFQAIARAPADVFRFGFIGSVLPTKGVHVLIDAFARLGRAGARLDIHGEILPWHEVSDYGARLQAQAAPLGERVRFHGRYAQEDLPRILGALDALVVPSLWYEAFCLTLREGFLAGVPVLVSNLGAMAEGVEDGVTALLFEPGNPAALAAQMARIMDDAGLRARLAASRKCVRTIAENAAELLAIYRSLARRAR